jgi:hypothetical protein
MMRQFTNRLKEGSDLRKGIEDLAKENLIKAGVIVSAVGGLLPANVRMPGAKVNRTWNEPVEIVSITGTLSEKILISISLFLILTGWFMGDILMRAVL